MSGLFVATGAIDTYLSAATVYKKHQYTNATFSFASYKENATPLLVLEDFWNPFIAPEKVVTNSITLGVDNPRNIVITGPNAGGKSTILKAVAINLLLGQTFGIVPAKKAVFTPFTKIGTHLNITDDIAAGLSLFKAEVTRAQELVAMIKACKQGEFCFIIMDELFNGTTPKEGQAAAYSFAKHIGEYPHTSCMLATHFDLLAQLEAQTQLFANYKISIYCNDDNSITYTFKLIPGISDQHIALDILRIEGFPVPLVNEAQALVQQQKQNNDV